MTKRKTYQPIENENVNSIQLKYESITINEMSVKFLIDTGSSVDIINKNSFYRIQSKGQKIKLFKTKKKLYPYAQDPIEMLGYFESLIESENRYTAPNSAILLNLVKLKSDDKNTVNKIEEENNNIDKSLEDYNDAFNGTGKLKNHEATLYLKGISKPIYQKMRRQLYHLRKLINKELKRPIENDIIEYLQGPQEWASNLLATPKRNGRIRLCLDARDINLCIQREMYPIPTLESVINNLTGATFFSKIHMKEAYQQLELSENCKYLTNFHTEKGIMRFKRLCYGINNSFEIFQKAIHQSLGNMPNTELVSNDIIIYTKTLQEHIITVKRLFEKLRDLNLKLSRKKFMFLQEKIYFFGVISLNKEIQPDPNKLNFLRNASRPRDVKELQSFLVFMTYWSRFIENFSEKTPILQQLLKENVKYR